MAEKIIPGLIRDTETISAATPYQQPQGRKDLDNAVLDKEVRKMGTFDATVESFKSGGNAAIQLKYDIDRMRQSGPVDPDWRDAGGNEKWLKANTSLIPGPQQWRYLQTKNATEAQLMLDDANYNSNIQIKLARRFELNPKSTFAAMALSGLIDVDLPLTIMSGGVSAGAKIGLNATKVGRLMSGAAGGAVAGAFVQGAAYGSNPVEDWTSVPVAGLAGAGFGVVGGALRRGAATPELAANDARIKTMDEFGEAVAGGNVRAKEDLRNEPHLHDDPYGARRDQEAADAAAAQPDPKPANAAEGPQVVPLDDVLEDTLPEDLPTLEGRSTVGARNMGNQGPGVASIRSTATVDMIQNARTRNTTLGISHEWFRNYSNLDDVSSVLANSARRFHDVVTATPIASDFQRFMRSGSVVGQMLAYDLLENASGIIRNNRSGAMLMDHYQKSMLGDFMPYHDSFDEWAGARNHNIWSKITDNSVREQFNRDIVQELNIRNYGTGPQPRHPADPAVAKAADAIDKAFAKEIEMNVGRAGEGSADGYKGIVPKSGYFPQKWLGGKMQKLINSGAYGAGAAGKQAIAKAISEAYLSMHPRMSPTDAAIWADAVVERALHTNEGISLNLVGILKDADGRKAIEDLMIRNGASKHEVDALVDKLTGTKEEAGRAGHTKNRMDADLNYVASNGIKLMDLVDTDINKIMGMRARKAAGSAALARKGINSRAKMEEIKEAILQEQVANGDSAKTGNRLEDAIDSDKHLTPADIDDMFSYFTGQPIAGGISPMYSRMRKLTNLSLLNQLGLTQAAEFGPMIAAVGWKKFGQMAGKEFMDSLHNADSPLVQELKHLNIFVPEERMFRDDLTFEYEKAGEAAAGEYMQKFDNFLNKGQRLQGYTSLFYTMRKFQQRIAVTSTATRLAKAAKLDDGSISLDRLRDMGFDPQTWERVQQNVHHMEFNAEGELVKLNLDRWNKAQDAEDFILALNRNSNQLVQKAMAGESSPLFHRDGVASLFWHLKSFPMLALEKQTMRNARMADGNSMGIFLYGLATASAAYTVKQAINGKTDNLTPERIARGAFGLSNMTGWIPMWVDPLAGMLGMDASLSGYGSYGSTSVLSVPAALTTLDRLTQLPGAAIAAINPMQDLDTSDIRALQTIPIIGNMAGFAYGFNAWKIRATDKRARERKGNAPAFGEQNAETYGLNPLQPASDIVVPERDPNHRPWYMPDDETMERAKKSSAGIALSKPTGGLLKVIMDLTE